MSCFTRVISQDSTRSADHRPRISGYIRSLFIAQHDDEEGRWKAYSGLHIRLNATKEIASKLTFRIDTRSQFLFGSSIFDMPVFSKGYHQEGESLNLRTLWWKRHGSAGYTNMERLSLDYSGKNISIKLGRQRIHWGMALNWNPNDVFQVGNLFDPDYAERPGVDALCIRKSLGPLTGFEFASARTGAGRSRGAIRYFVNRSGYDLQFISGWYGPGPMLGFGYSGSEGNWSHRGEIQAFILPQPHAFQLQSVWETDRLLPGNQFIKAAMLYNRRGAVGGKTITSLFSPQPDQLMPGKWNALMGWSREESLRFRWGVDLLYSTAAHSVILFPQLDCSFSRDWSLLFYLQWVQQMISGRSFQQMFLRIGRILCK